MKILKKKQRQQRALSRLRKKLVEYAAQNATSYNVTHTLRDINNLEKKGIR